MKKLDEFSWQSEEKIKKPIWSYLKVFLISIFGLFFAVAFLGLVDLYFFWNGNKEKVKELQASVELLRENLKQDLEKNDFAKASSELGGFREKIKKLSSELEEKDKVTLKILGVSTLLDEAENLTLESVSVGENLLKIQNLLGKTQEKNYKKNPVEEIFEKIDEIKISNEKILSKTSLIENFSFGKIKGKVDFAEENLEKSLFLLKDFGGYKELVSKILGKDKLQTTVIFFQNTNELRPTGGFVGSFLIFSALNGKVLNWEISDVYKYDGQIQEKLLTPFSAEKVAGEESWSLRDFNSSPFLETSAENFNYLFEKAGGKTVDNFIFLDHRILGDLIGVFGEIKLGIFGEKLYEKNYDFVVQYLVESKKNQSISPKVFIFKEIFDFMKENLDLEKIFLLYDLKNKFFEEKKIQIFSFDSGVKKELEKLNLEQNLDLKSAVLPVFISLSGNKSDAFIKNQIEVEKVSDYEFLVKIKRKFEIPSFLEEEFERLFAKHKSQVEKEELRRILGFGKNNSILQIYAKGNVELLLTKGLKSRNWQEGNLKVFEIELEKLAPSEKKEFELLFKSEEKIGEIGVSKQAGSIF